MLCLSFYEWRCIYLGEQMILAPFLEKCSLDRAPGWFADNLSVRKHAKADVLLTMVLGPLRWRPFPRVVCDPAAARPPRSPRNQGIKRQVIVSDSTGDFLSLLALQWSTTSSEVGHSPPGPLAALLKPWM